MCSITRSGIALILLAPTMTSASQSCFVEAGQRHRVDPDLLEAIACVESNHNPSAVNRQSAGNTYDVGLMQINSWWLPRLSSYGITEGHLYDGCVSTYIGAWILSQNFAQYGYDWRAIGAYNAGTDPNPTAERLRFNYAQKVYRAYEEGCDA